MVKILIDTMKYSLINNCNIKISQICLGTEIYSRKNDYISSKEINKIFSLAFEKGINFIDTAECYGDHESEKKVGNIIKKNRDQWVVATKFGHTYNANSNIDSFDLNAVKKQLELSLKSLKSEYIDIYYFHSGDDKSFFNDDLWNYLNKQVSCGKIRSLGLSVKHSLVLKNNLMQVKRAKEFNIKIINTVYNYLNKDSSDFLFKICNKNKLTIIGRMPLAKGILAGKYQSNKDFAKNDIRSKSLELNERYFSIINNELSHISKCDLAKWSLNWTLSNKSIDSTVIAFRNTNQLNELIV